MIEIQGPTIAFVGLAVYLAIAWLTMCYIVADASHYAPFLDRGFDFPLWAMVVFLSLIAGLMWPLVIPCEVAQLTSERKREKS
jgi:hypothetical protein